jgi:hypothetical protein
VIEPLEEDKMKPKKVEKEEGEKQMILICEQYTMFCELGRN